MRGSLSKSREGRVEGGMANHVDKRQPAPAQISLCTCDTMQTKKRQTFLGNGGVGISVPIRPGTVNLTEFGLVEAKSIPLSRGLSSFLRKLVTRNGTSSSFFPKATMCKINV